MIKFIYRFDDKFLLDKGLLEEVKDQTENE